MHYKYQNLDESNPIVTEMETAESHENIGEKIASKFPLYHEYPYLYDDGSQLYLNSLSSIQVLLTRE